MYSRRSALLKCDMILYTPGLQSMVGLDDFSNTGLRLEVDQASTTSAGVDVSFVPSRTPLRCSSGCWLLAAEPYDVDDNVPAPQGWRQTRRVAPEVMSSESESDEPAGPLSGLDPATAGVPTGPRG